MNTARQPQLGWSLYLGVGLGLVLIIGLAGASALLARRNAESLTTVSRSQDTRATLSAAMHALEEAETGQRGFLLTRREAYLQPYEHGVQNAPAAIEALSSAFRQSALDGSERPLLAQLQQLVTDKLEELARTIELERGGDRAGALALVQTDRGQRDMDAIRTIVANLERQQQGVLDEQVEAVNRGGRLLVWADTLGFVLLAVLGAAIGWGAWQAFRALRSSQTALALAYDAVTEANLSLEDRVAERTAALTEANDEIQRFAYIVSHDLRAPLVNIMGFTSEMESAAATVRRFVAANGGAPGAEDARIAAAEDIPESIGFIKTSTAKMDRLIGAILKLSREGRRVLARETVAMRPLLEGIAASMQHQAAERGAAVVVQPMPDVVTDRLVLEQVFSNLVENALKYLQPGRPGRIVVSGRVEEPMAIFEVEDNGRGIAARDLERVFELFRRAGDQTVPGEGIGLAHVRALVRRLGGRIDCVSREGVGSTFRVEIPRSQPEQAPS